MQGLRGGEARAQIVDAMVMRTVKLRELFRQDVHWQVGELQRQGHDLLSFWIAILAAEYCKQPSRRLDPFCIEKIILTALRTLSPMLSHKEKLLRNFRTNHREKLLNARRTQINEAMAEQERRQFMGIFPTITGENYEEHRWKIA